MKSLEERIKELPPEQIRMVEAFLESLAKKSHRRRRKKPAFSWAGALKDLREQYTSVELQHMISKLRSGEK